MTEVSRRRRRARDYALAVEAAVGLAMARVAVAILPFQRISAWTRRGVSGNGPADRERGRVIEDVRWAVAAAAARLPGDTRCFPRALAAQAMLRRRGVPSALVYGARPQAGQLDAHVWVTVGADIVVGDDVAHEYSHVVTYSSGSPDSRVQEKGRA
jgi:transglutaminase superfamily protein